MLRTTPPGEDDTGGGRAIPVSLNAKGTPPGEDGTMGGGEEQLENTAEQNAEYTGVETEPDEGGIDFLQLVRQAEDQALLYVAQVNRKAWSQSLRAFHQEHYVGSKYTQPDWRGRSRLFVPKTRAAVRKDLASVAASLFNNIDAVSCLPGNDGDAKQRGAAAVMEEIVNYRTTRSSGKASFPWFLASMGARQDAVLTGICVSKQSWKQEFRKSHSEAAPGGGARDVYKLTLDRPDVALVPPENMVIDPAADWTNPIQSAAFVIIKWPMQVEEIKEKQDSPVSPWLPVSEDILKQSVESGKWDMAAIRRAREQGLDRLDETQTGTHFQVVWVYETFMRVAGEDWTFFSVGDQHYLTEPRPVQEVYPEQFGERPLAMGYGNLEAHRIFPMSPAESWQQLQVETNDIRNLTLDAVKQNVMPITKVRRGRQIDLDQVKRRSSGSSILVTEPDDVTWEPAPIIQQSSIEMKRELDLEFDDLAGQQNYGSVETNNALGKTLGGLKLAAGAANAVQEMDVRVWIETWAQPTLEQVVRLEQYYESDAEILGICGQRAKLFKKFGISKIDDDLLEQQISVRVSVGLGAGDPMQRLAKFSQATQIIAPLLAQTKEFQSGQVEINWEAISEEVYGAAGYKDGGARFFRDNGTPAANPMADLKTEELKAKIEKDKRTGVAALLTGLSSVGKVALGKRDLEANTVDMLLGHQGDAQQRGFDHGHRHNDQILSAMDHGHRHGMAINEHHRNLRNDVHQQAQAATEAANQGGDAGNEGPAPQAPAAAPSQAGPPAQPPASPPPAQNDAVAHLMAGGQIEFTRGTDGRINGLKMKPVPGGHGSAQIAGPASYPAPQRG